MIQSGTALAVGEHYWLFIAPPVVVDATISDELFSLEYSRDVWKDIRDTGEVQKRR
jgi:hypothetical protein